jgi:hypothetical protein
MKRPSIFRRTADIVWMPKPFITLFLTREAIFWEAIFWILHHFMSNHLYVNTFPQQHYPNASCAGPNPDMLYRCVANHCFQCRSSAVVDCLMRLLPSGPLEVLFHDKDGKLCGSVWDSAQGTHIAMPGCGPSHVPFSHPLPPPPPPSPRPIAAQHGRGQHIL